MTDTTNTCGEGAELPNKHVPDHPDAYLNALLDYTKGFYSATREAGLPAKVCADAMQHVESAARGLHRKAIAAPTQKSGHALDVTLSSRGMESSASGVRVDDDPQTIEGLVEVLKANTAPDASINLSGWDAHLLVEALTDPRALTAGEAVAWVMPGVLPIMRARGLSGDIMPVADDEFTMPLYASPQPARMPTREEADRVAADLRQIEAWIDGGERRDDVPAGAIKELFQVVRRLALFTPSAGVDPTSQVGEGEHRYGSETAAEIIKRWAAWINEVSDDMEEPEWGGKSGNDVLNERDFLLKHLAALKAEGAGK